MTDVEILLKSSNIEMDLLEYFDMPTAEEAKALRVIVARLQSDQDAARERIERAMKYKG